MSVLPHCSLSQESLDLLDENLFQELISKIATFNSGRLELIIGPMFSGKSSKLIHEITTLADQGMQVLYINHLKDQRQTQGDNSFSTHSSHYRGLSSKITAIKVENLDHLEIENYDVIGIDEGQFYPDLLKVVEWLNYRKIVFVAGLDGDAYRQPFGQILFLIPHCDNLIKLKARCHRCLESSRHLKDRLVSLVDAPFTGRLIDGEQTLVGGADIYLPLCRYHHDQHLSKK